MKKRRHKNSGRSKAASSFPYQAVAVTDETGLSDIAMTAVGEIPDGQTLPPVLWGHEGRERELAFASSVPEGALPVFLGTGLGVALEALLERGLDVAVMDLEDPILAVAGVRKRYASDPRVTFFSAETPAQALQLLSKWQIEHGLRRLFPICFPFYGRLNRAFYGELSKALRQSMRYDFQKELAYPKFTSAKPRVLLVRSGYFLEQEISEALDSLGVEHLPVAAPNTGKGDTGFVARLLDAVVSFKPDFVLTVNHLGLDREGVLQNLLDQLSIPLASWFVDNPYLILYLYGRMSGKRTAIFSYDADSLPQLRSLGFDNVFYLPLGASVTRFRGCAEEVMDVSFVGNSMVGPVQRFNDKSYLPGQLLKNYQKVAGEFARSDERAVVSTLERSFPDARKIFDGLRTMEHRLTYEQLVVFEATRQYRTDCVRHLLPFGPTVFGDDGWLGVFGQNSGCHLKPEVDYYSELPRVYSATKVNFNCTSLQMKGAVNQRVFDVPACGRFVLTDARPQMDALFEPGVESVAYSSPDEIPDLVRYYLENDDARHSVAEAAGRRVRAEHTYEHRLKSLLATMRETFA